MPTTLLPEICRTTQNSLATLLDGELSPDQAKLAEAHIVICPDCTAYRSALVATLTAIDSAPSLAADINVADSILRHIASETASGEPEQLSPELLTATHRARAEAEGVPFINLNRHKPEAKAIACLSAETAWLHNALPIRRDGQTLFVAMANPQDNTAVDAVRLESRCMVRPMLAVPELLQEEIAKAYPRKPGVSDSSVSPSTDELQSLRDEVAAMRREMADLRAQLATISHSRRAVPQRPGNTTRLFPFAPPSGLPERGER